MAFNPEDFKIEDRGAILASLEEQTLVLRGVLEDCQAELFDVQWKISILQHGKKDG